ncbi:Olfactory receptor 2B11 [Heterocephalus glaber]|uniref:Olfactory receptor 2B11 n=1 Tax=Heterocephalus glaber TaxID=10181 RepID=G5C9B8_HETGA|nr:Olfactory receptor 2B11 [Heterocephalus glaber]
MTPRPSQPAPHGTPDSGETPHNTPVDQLKMWPGVTNKPDVTQQYRMWTFCDCHGLDCTSSIYNAGAMERENVSFPNTFVLLGFSEFPWLERPLFAVVLVSYLLTLVGNSSIILLSLVDPRLQTPMYFFLDNLSLLDLCITCTILPQLLANLSGPDKTIAAWAASWSSGPGHSLIQATLTIQLPLCGQHTLDHFFCEVPVLIELACGDTSDNELALVIGAILFVLLAPLMVLISYTLIARAVLKLPSAEGRHKALSTCSSHLLVVTMFFGPSIYMYLQPPANSTQAKFMSFFYCIITPVLNPLIYTLRNNDVKRAWKRILQSQHGMKS